MTLEIFDVQGRRVRTLANTTVEPGFHAIDWDHRDDRGNILRAGMFMYRIQAGANESQRKMTLVP